MSDDERDVLWQLGEAGEEMALSFSAFELPRDRARAACRSLKAKGLAQFWRGLWTEEGQPAGSGYSITEKGMEFYGAMAVFNWEPHCACWRWPAEPIWRDPRDVLAELAARPAAEPEG